jgi:hypothetical protein
VQKLKKKKGSGAKGLKKGVQLWFTAMVMHKSRVPGCPRN